MAAVRQQKTYAVIPQTKPSFKMVTDVEASLSKYGSQDSSSSPQSCNCNFAVAPSSDLSLLAFSYKQKVNIMHFTVPTDYETIANRR
jgi:hypothetical protein